MRRGRSSTSGIALMEVLVALVILTAVGVPLLGRVGAEVRLLIQRSDQESLVRAAEAALVEYAALDRVRLEQRLGRRSAGTLDVLLERPSQTLFHIAVVEPDAGDRQLMVTYVYRASP